MKRKTGNRFLIGVLIFSLLFSSIGLMGLTVPVTETAKEAPADNPDAWDGVTANVNWYFGIDKKEREKENAVFTLNTPEDLAGMAVLVNYRDVTFCYDKSSGKVITTEDGTVIYKNKDGTVFPKGSEFPTGDEFISEKGTSFPGMKINLASDIDLQGYPWHAIGSTGSWQGTFNGNSHTISNLYVTTESAKHMLLAQVYAGLFGGLASSGKVTDLVLENVEIDLNIPNGTVGYVGGVAGSVQGTASITKVTINGLKTTITNKNTEEGKVLAGAAIGQYKGSGEVSGLTVNNYYFDPHNSTGVTTGSGATAEMIGKADGTASKPDTLKLTRGVPAYGTTLANIKWYIDGKGDKGSTYTVKTEADLAGLAVLVNNRNDQIWYDADGNVISVKTEPADTAGLNSLPELPSDPKDKTNDTIRTFKDKTVTLGADIDYEGRRFLTIGCLTSWAGTLDGGNHTLKNVRLNTASSMGRSDKNYYMGLIGYMGTGSVLKNLTVENMAYDLSVKQGSTYYAGGLVGDFNSGSLANVTVKGLDAKIFPETATSKAANVYYSSAVGITRKGVAAADCSGILIVDYTLTKTYDPVTTEDMLVGLRKNSSPYYTDCHVLELVTPEDVATCVHEGEWEHFKCLMPDCTQLYIETPEGEFEKTDTEAITGKTDPNHHVKTVEELEWTNNSDPETHAKLCDCGVALATEAHQFETKYDPEPTTEAGGMKYQECTVCHYETAKEAVGPLDREHVVTAHPEVPATCTTPGTHAYWTCSHPTCEGKKYKSEDCTDVWDEDELTIAVDASAHTGNTDETLHSDENGHFKVCSECKKEFDREAHNPGTEWKTGDGKHWHECADCGFHTSEAAHTMEWVVDKAATTEAEGSRHEACTACGATGKTESIPKLAKTVWDGKTVDVSWYFSNPNADTFTISTPEQLAGMAVLMNYRDQTFYYDANGKVVTTESGEVIYKIKDVIYPAGATEPTGDGITATGGNSFKGKTIKLAGDIDLGGKPFAPIGCGSSFQGTFDGDGHTISNLYITTEKGRHTTLTEQHYVGLFGVLAADAQVKNFTLQNVEMNIAVPEGATLVHVGAIASDIRQQSSVTDVAVKGLKVRVTENGGNCALVLGALIGDDATTGTVDKLSAQNYDYEAKYSGKILTEEDETIGRIQSAASKPGTLTVQKGSATTGDALLTVGTVSLAVLCLGGAVLLGKKKKEH